MFSAPQSLSQNSSRAGSNHVRTCPRCRWWQNIQHTHNSSNSFTQDRSSILGAGKKRGAGTHTRITKYALCAWSRGFLWRNRRNRTRSLDNHISHSRDDAPEILRDTRFFNLSDNFFYLKLKTKLNCQVQQPISGSSPRSLAKDRPSWMIFRRSTLHLFPTRNHTENAYNFNKKWRHARKKQMTA